MVCIQCYLPPIMFMVYMKFLHPYVGPYLEPIYNKVISYFWGAEALNSACPIRPGTSRNKTAAKTGEPEASSTSAAAGEEPQASSRKDQ